MYLDGGYKPNFIGLEFILCGVSIYLCFVQWNYFYRDHACCSCYISGNRIQSGLLAVSSTLVAISTLADIVLAAYLKKWRTSHLQVTMADTSFTTPYSTIYNGSGVDSSIRRAQTTWTQDPKFLLLTVLILVTICMIALFIIYGVIWQRQRAIYRSSALSHLSNMITRFLSKYFPVFMAAVAIFVIGFLLYGFFNRFTGLLTVVLMPITWSIQIPILILFIYPLIKAIYYNRTSNITTDRKYVRLIQRVTILTAMCLASDTVMALSYWFYSDMDLNLKLSLFHLNIIINLICVNLIPSDWTLRLLPCVRSCSRNRQVVVETIYTDNDDNDTNCDTFRNHASNLWVNIFLVSQAFNWRFVPTNETIK